MKIILCRLATVVRIKMKSNVNIPAHYSNKMIKLVGLFTRKSPHCRNKLCDIKHCIRALLVIPF